MNKFVYSLDKYSCQNGIADSLKFVYKTNQPVIICVGSDLVIGDSLGPLVGTLLEEKLKGKAYLYGTLNSPITAKESLIISKTIKLLHPSSKILVIDAGVGDKSDIGLIKVCDNGIKPGLGVNKQLPEIGDASIIGIVTEKNDAFTNITTSTRFSFIYKMSNAIANGIEKYFNLNAVY